MGLNKGGMLCVLGSTVADTFSSVRTKRWAPGRSGKGGMHRSRGKGKKKLLSGRKAKSLPLSNQ